VSRDLNLNSRSSVRQIVGQDDGGPNLLGPRDIGVSFRPPRVAPGQARWWSIYFASLAMPSSTPMVVTPSPKISLASASNSEPFQVA